MLELAFVLVLFAGMAAVILAALVRGDDAAGTATPVAVVASPTATSEPPPSDLAFTARPDRLTNQTEASFSFVWNGNEFAAFECRIDEGTFSTCGPAGRTYEDLPDGTHTFQVRLVVQPGQEEFALASYAWTIDTSVPEVEIQPENATFATALRVQLSSSEPAALYYTTDGSEPTVQSSRYSDPIVIRQPLTIQAIAVDRAGNASRVASTSFAFDLSFEDTFESGALDLWADLEGAELDSGSRLGGQNGLRVIGSDGDHAYATLDFAETVPELYASASFRLNSRGENPVTLFRARSAVGESLASVYVAANGRLAVQFANGESQTSSSIINAGVWFNLQVQVTTTNVDTAVRIWLNGEPIDDLATSRSLPSGPVASFQYGESSNGRLFDLSIDNVRLDDTFIATSAIIIFEGSGPTPAPGTPEQ